MPRKTTLLAISAIVALALVGTATARRAGAPDSKLLAQYEPVMHFDPLERFRPTRVESFITDADLEQLTAPGTWSTVKKNAPPGDLPGAGSGTWRLNEDACTPSAPLGGLACYAAAQPTSGEPTVYGRVARENDRIVLQYWFFYYDDVYSYTYPASDFIWQAHEGDWENVEVVLSAGEEPLFVGYSQHCLGQTRTWDDTLRFDDTHPVVHVAVGSHANYFTAGTHPINTACIPAEALMILKGSGLPLPVDYAFEGPVAGPPGSGGDVMPIADVGTEGAPWLQFPGSWGEAQYFHAPAPIGTVASGASPVGPAFHPEWTDPLSTLATWPSG